MSLEHSPARQSPSASVDRMLRTRDVLAAMGWSRTTLWRRVRAGDFPPPVELGPNSNGWLESWVNAARDALPRRTYGSNAAEHGTEAAPGEQSSKPTAETN